MGALKHTVHAVIRSGEERWFVAECLEIAVVTQGRTVDETLSNLKEAVSLYFEGEDLAALGFAPAPTVVVSIDVEPVYA